LAGFVILQIAVSYAAATSSASFLRA
jgi:hypothetical protein